MIGKVIDKYNLQRFNNILWDEWFRNFNAEQQKEVFKLRDVTSTKLADDGIIIEFVPIITHYSFQSMWDKIYEKYPDWDTKKDSYSDFSNIFK